MVRYTPKKLTGSIYQRKDGMWIGAVTVPGHPGEPQKRRTVSARDRGVCEQKLDDLLVMLRAEMPSGPKTLTVEKWMDQWLDDIAPGRLDSNTIAGYRAVTNSRIIPILGKVRLVDLTPAKIRRLDDKKSRASQLAHSALSSALRDAEVERVILRNPMKGMRKPHRDTPETETFSPTEVEAILGTITMPSGHVYDEHDLAQPMPSSTTEMDVRVLTAIMTGARQSEIMGMRWGDLELDAKNPVWTLKHQVKRVKQGDPIPADALENLSETAFLARTKSRKPRTIPLADILARDLILWRAHYAILREVSDPEMGKLFVFTNDPDGRLPIRKEHDGARWKKALERIGVRPLGTHAARRALATMLDDPSVTDKTIADLLGHAKVSQTWRYQQARVEAARDAVGGIKHPFDLEG